MAFTPDGAESSLSVFGSYVSEMAPPDLPEGVSPACQDVSFLPGDVGSRPCLQKVFVNAFAADIVSGKSYVNPTGDIENLYLTADGKLWWEDVTYNPGVATLIATVAPESYMKSCTAFGREYIGISNAQIGSDVPLQWDGSQLNRVTQDGPGVAPLVSSIALPPVVLAATGALSLAPNEVQPGGTPNPDGSWSQIYAFTYDSITSIVIGSSMTLAGYTSAAAVYNGTWTVLNTYVGSINLVVLAAYLPAGTVFSSQIAGVTWENLAEGVESLIRTGNVVSATTATAHQLQVGYLAQIAGVPAQVIAGPSGSPPAGAIVSITIDNEEQPGIATVVTTDPHGLLPQNQITLTGVAGVAVGGAITAATWSGGIAAISTTTAHGLTVGAVVTIAGVGSATTGMNGTFPVLAVQGPTSFTYLFTPLAVPTISLSTPTTTLNWPVPDTTAPTYFEVQSSPTPTSFQIAVNYSDGAWATGTVSFGWIGTFFVTAKLSDTSFQYQQYGPNGSSGATTGSSVTPFGQAAPGLRQCAVAFLTRNGAITAFSPPVTFEANGGQYLSISAIPIGPATVTGRILLFTGAEGQLFYYIPAPAQENGLIVSTATQINDNVTTQVLLDFSDPTLFAATGASIPGNDLASQVGLDGALGFGVYASRLITWGQRNRIGNLLNMGFDGGYVSQPPGIQVLPSGWTAGWDATQSGSLIASPRNTPLADFGEAWQTACPADTEQHGNLQQSLYQDFYGAPIATPNTQYTIRAWLQVSTQVADITFWATMTSASTGFTAYANVSGAAISTTGAFHEATFNLTTPAVIPQDLILTTFWVNNGGVQITGVQDEQSMIYTDTPYVLPLLGSYVNNPEGLDGVTGPFGPNDDQQPVMDFSIIRKAMYILTQEPAGRLHQTEDNGVTEPAGWNVEELAAICGALGPFAVTKSQADNASASGGEEWMAWASASGARIFGGGQPALISQEIKPDWIGADQAGALQWSSSNGINWTFQNTAWVINNPITRVLYFGVPLGGNPQGSPTKIYQMDYKELATAYDIAESPPYRVSFAGKLVATDRTRKWAPWNLPMNGAALMYRAPGNLSAVFFGGNGAPPGVLPGFGNCYTLNSSKYTDDDYGQVYSSYTTYFFVSRDQEQALSYMAGQERLNLGGGRKLLAYLIGYVSGVGQVTLTVQRNRLNNPSINSCVRQLAQQPNFDLEWGGGNVQAQRMAIQVASSPLPNSTDNAFSLQRLSIWLRRAKLYARGSAQQ